MMGLSWLRHTKIHHLIRYFLLVALIAILSYLFEFRFNVGLIFIGPCLYLSHWLRSLLAQLSDAPAAIPPGFVVVPVTFLYYGFVGYLIKQLWNEQGKVRLISLTALLIFLFFIHFAAWRDLTLYYYCGVRSCNITSSQS